MSSCAVKRWGPGTTCERPQNTEAVKELNARMAALSAERDKQDQMWNSPGTETKDKSQTGVKPFDSLASCTGISSPGSSSSDKRAAQ